MYEISNAEELDRLKINLARDYIAHIDELKEQMATLEERREFIAGTLDVGGIDPTREKVKTSPTADAIPNAVITLMETQEELEASAEFEQREIAEFKERVAKLTTLGGLILQYLYLFPVPLKDEQIYGKYMPMARTTYFRRKEDGLIELYDKGLPAPYRLPDEKAV